MHKYISSLKDKNLSKIVQSSDAVEIYKSIENEFFLKNDRSNMPFMVLSAEIGEGKSTVAAIYALLAAKNTPEKQILFLNATSSKNILSGTGNESNNNSVDIKPTGIENLFICDLNIADRVGFPYEMLSQLLESNLSKYWRIVIDVDSANKSQEYMSVSKIVKNVVLVVEHGKTKREQVNLLTKNISTVGANVIGAIFNKRYYPLPEFIYEWA